MSKQKRKEEKIIGICRLCKKNKELSFEHFPPSSAFNKTTKYFSIPHDEFYANSGAESLLNFIPKGKKIQGGLGDYCLCEECNNFLGTTYVREYKKWALMGMHLINRDEFKSCSVEISEINYLKIIKQIISIFICNNLPSFTDSYSDLIDFVKDENSKILSPRYRIYIYLNNEGQLRNGNIYYTNLYGIVCEFTFRPFGYVLSIDNNSTFEMLTELTELKNILNYEKTGIQMFFNKYPTYLPFPLDYRTKKEIESCL